jgi:hypothetical protein
MFGIHQFPRQQLLIVNGYFEPEQSGFVYKYLFYDQGTVKVDKIGNVETTYYVGVVVTAFEQENCNYLYLFMTFPFLELQLVRIITPTETRIKKQ